MRGPLFDEIMGVLRPRRHNIAGMPAPSGEEVRRFFRELTPRAASNGWLSLWVLRFGGQVVETEYQLVADGRVHALRRDADQTPPALRLGDVLTARCTEVSKAGRTGVYDAEVTNQRGERVAVFRGRSYTIKGKPAVGG